jgi:hypothetical protein
MSTVRIFRPAYVIDELGELGRLPDGAITNIGGTDAPYFTVGGRALLFADGTATTPTPGVGVNLQTTYANSLNGNINLADGKNFILTSTSGKRFIVDGTTGLVTIDGDLNVLGASNVIEGSIQNTDSLTLAMPTSLTVGLSIAPQVGITPLANLVEVRTIFAGTPVFSITPGGLTHVNSLTVDGLINGINLGILAASVNTHLDGTLLPAKHSAAQVSANTAALVNVTGSNVQQVIESIDAKLSTFSAGGVQGVEYTQVGASIVWTIAHNKNSRRVQITVWDGTDQEILADTVSIVDANTVRIVFNTPATGRAILMVF